MLSRARRSRHTLTSSTRLRRLVAPPHTRNRSRSRGTRDWLANQVVDSALARVAGIARGFTLDECKHGKIAGQRILTKSGDELLYPGLEQRRNDQQQVRIAAPDL